MRRSLRYCCLGWAITTTPSRRPAPRPNGFSIKGSRWFTPSTMTRPCDPSGGLISGRLPGTMWAVAIKRIIVAGLMLIASNGIGRAGELCARVLGLSGPPVCCCCQVPTQSPDAKSVFRSASRGPIVPASRATRIQGAMGDCCTVSPAPVNRDSVPPPSFSARSLGLEHEIPSLASSILSVQAGTGRLGSSPRWPHSGYDLSDTYLRKLCFRI